jgi:large subunit ribosomal protein L18
MKKLDVKQKRRIRRKKHVRKNVFGNEDRLRLTVFKSLNNISAQLINDDEGTTLVAASSIDKDIKPLIKPDMNKVEQSKIVGTELAKRALEKGLKRVAFDRNGFIYRGRIRAFADAARKGGLEF